MPTRAEGPTPPPGRGNGKEWKFENLTEKQGAAFSWIFRRDPTLWRALNYRTGQLTRNHSNAFLISHILDAVYALRDTPGLLKLLAGATANYHIVNGGRGRESYEIMGAVHEILRLGHLTAPADPIDVIGYIEEVLPEGENDPLLQKRQIEIDGILRSGIALEFKLAVSGFKVPDHKMKDQASRYARILRDGKITGVQYHITSPQIDSAAIRTLAETIPGVKVFRYDSLLTSDGRLNTRREEIDTDFHLWTF